MKLEDLALPRVEIAADESPAEAAVPEEASSEVEEG